ncbi:MAG: class I SAM-dependent methyltransferase [Verrucomicrobiales bacterium]
MNYGTGILTLNQPLLSLVCQLFDQEPEFVSTNYIELPWRSELPKEEQTSGSFSEKWGKLAAGDKSTAELEQFQLDWYLKLYGFADEDDFCRYLSSKHFILDAGCGLGYKSAWMAKLAPHALVIGMDYSDAARLAAKRYSDIPNLCFVRNDIAKTGLKPELFDFVLCDQVIHHTEDPVKTFAHLAGLLTKAGEFACYVYARKALPRELVDSHFRRATLGLSSQQIWDLSEQLTRLGKALADLKTKIEVPDIPLLDIRGGEYDLQRFVYWNFIKCFWNAELGWDMSVATNFDWYSPSTAFRYSEEEFRRMISGNALGVVYFHAEEACYSGRFRK